MESTTTTNSFTTNALARQLPTTGSLNTLNTLNTLSTDNLFQTSFLQASSAPVQATKFTADLFQPVVIDANKGGTLQMEMRETQQWLGLVDASGKPVLTTVWTYGQQGKPETFTYPGPTIVAYRDKKLNVKWDNQLPVDPGSPYPGAIQYDPRIHFADPM